MGRNSSCVSEVFAGINDQQCASSQSVHGRRKRRADWGFAYRDQLNELERETVLRREFSLILEVKKMTDNCYSTRCRTRQWREERGEKKKSGKSSRWTGMGNQEGWSLAW